MALFAFFFSWLWCWITGDRNAKHKKTKALPKWWSINQYKPLLFLPLAPTPTLKYVGDQQNKNKKNNCFQRNNNYMLVALFRPYNQTQTDRKKVAAAMKLMLCLTQEMESSSSFRCAHAWTLRTLAWIRWRILGGQRHCCPYTNWASWHQTTTPNDTKLFNSTQYAKKKTGTHFSRSFGQLGNGPLVWRY